MRMNRVNSISVPEIHLGETAIWAGVQDEDAGILAEPAGQCPSEGSPIMVSAASCSEEDGGE